VTARPTLALDVGTKRVMQRVIGQVRNALVRTWDGLVAEKDGDVVRWRVG